jgi:CspA family cold shock protein
VPTGSVIRFDRRRGYGFITPDEPGEDVFVHQNNIQMDGFRFLNVGEKVTYDLEVGEKGMKAVSVQLVEPRPEGASERPAFDSDERDNPRDFRPRAAAFDRPARPQGFDRPARQSGGDSDSAEQLDKLRRKHERLISILVEKGVLAPGEIDALAASAGG